MNPTRPSRSHSRQTSAALTSTTRRRPIQATDRMRRIRKPIVEAVGSKVPARQFLNALSPIVHEVVDGFMDSLQSTGEGVLPIVLVLQPELSTRGIAESDAEFARRGRRQSAAEKRFFRTIEVALRDAMGTILGRAALAVVSGGAGLRRRRENKGETVMAAGGRTSPRKAHLLQPRATCPA